MSELVKTSKSWHEYNQIQLLIRILKEVPDCSFRVTGIQDCLSSYRWILQEISPIISRIFENHGTFKEILEIPINDPNFDIIISYAHTKIVHNRPLWKLLSLFESACKFKISCLMQKIERIIEMNLKTETRSFNKWITWFYMNHMKQYHDSFKDLSLDEMTVIISTQDLKKALKENIQKFTTFKTEMFCDFLATLKTKGVDPFLCFECLTVYLADDKISEIIKREFKSFNRTRDVAKTFLQNIDFSKISFEDVKNNLEKSELLDTKKEWLLAEIMEIMYSNEGFF